MPYKNKEDAIKNRKRHFLENREEILKKQKIYYLENKEKINKQHREYHLNNKEKISKKCSEYYFKNKEQISKIRYIDKWFCSLYLTIKSRNKRMFKIDCDFDSNYLKESFYILKKLLK